MNNTKPTSPKKSKEYQALVDRLQNNPRIKELIKKLEILSEHLYNEKGSKGK